MCESVVGADVSEAMLKEARRNCDEREITNVQLVESDDALSGLSGDFDFVHSFLVFQHIPPRRGMAIFRRLIGLLADGGVGVVHFTYYRRTSALRRLAYWMRRKVPLFNALLNLLVLKKPFRDPLVQMNEYELGAVFRVLQEKGCHRCFVRFTLDAGGKTDTYGTVIFFEKKASPYL